MPRESFPQKGFTAGELKDALKARSDFDKYHKGVDRAKNVVVEPTGGLKRRPGTQHIDEIPFNSQYIENNGEMNFKLINFAARENESYIGVLTNTGSNTQLIFYRDDNIKTILDASNSNIPLPYDTDEIEDVDWVQRLDTLILLHENYQPRQVKRLGTDSFSIEKLEFENIPQYKFSDSNTNNIRSGIINSKGNNPNDVLWNDDGSKMYELDTDLNEIHEYTLSENYKIKTASLNNTINTNNNNIISILWGNNGNKFFQLENDGTIYDYNAGTAYDITSLTIVVRDPQPSISENNVVDFNFTNSGNTLFIAENNNDLVIKYQLGTAWDPSTLSSVTNKKESTMQFITADHKINEIFWNDKKNKLYVMYKLSDQNTYNIAQLDINNKYTIENIDQYNPDEYDHEYIAENIPYVTGDWSPDGKTLRSYSNDSGYGQTNIKETSVKYDINSINNTYNLSYDFPASGVDVVINENGLEEPFFCYNDQVKSTDNSKTLTGTNFVSLAWGSEGYNLYVLDDSEEKIYQYETNDKYDVNSLSLVDSISTQYTNPKSITIDDESFVIIEASAAGELIKHVMSTKNDITTASTEFNHERNFKQNEPVSIDFNNDTSKMYILNNENNINQYKLNENNNILSSEYSKNLELSSNNASGLDWDSSGDSLIIGDIENNNINQYKIQTQFEVNTGYINNTNTKNEIQRINFSGMSDGDSFDISLDGSVTSEIRWNGSDNQENADRIQDALRRLSITGKGIDVSVDDDTNNKFLVNFTDDDGNYDWETMIATIFIGSGSVSVSEVQAGDAGKEDVWSQTRGWPKHGAFYQSRLFFGGSKELPETVWASVVNEPFNFDLGDGDPNDAIQTTIDSDQVSAINWIQPGRSLFIGTGLVEYYVPDEPITPQNFRVVSATKRGANGDVKPINSDGSLYYVTRGGNSVRELIYSFDVDSFQSRDISILSSHLINNPQSVSIKQSSGNDSADRVLVINEDGTAGTLSLLKSQDVQGFTHTVTDGYIIKSRGQDFENYIITKRHTYEPEWEDKGNWKINEGYLQYSASVIKDGEFHILGGETTQPSLTDGIVDNHVKYNIKREEWVGSKELPISVKYPSATELEGNIYIGGGLESLQNETNSATDKFYMLDDNENWIQKQNLPVSTDTHEILTVNDEIYFFDNDSTYKYDKENDSWVQKTTMPKERRHFGACADSNNRVYITGGLDSDINKTGTVQIYDVINDNWRTSTKFKMNYKREHHACELLDLKNGKEKVVVFGNDEKTTEVFDIENENWKELNKHKYTGGNGPPAVSKEDKLFTIFNDGDNDTTPINSVFTNIFSYKNKTNYNIEKINDNRLFDASVKGEKTKLDGLNHLEGREVDVYIDGIYQGTKVVNSNGNVNLDKKPEEYVEVGLPMPTPEIKLLPPSLASSKKTITDRRKRIVEVQVQLQNTKSLKVAGEKLAFREWGANLLDQAPEEFTGKKRVEAIPGYSRTPQITITQPVPQPFTLLGTSQVVTF